MRAPSYLRLHRSGILQKRAEEAIRRLEECRLCPRECGVNRLRGELGTCRTGRRVRLASFNPHFGEERELVGRSGSGTIFFSSCSLLCSFCQNADISHLNRGTDVGAHRLASAMLRLQEAGCRNVNFVTPTHVVAQILEALPTAVEGGLRIPLVYNCGGYEKVETLKLLEGIFDIYMPDFKFWNPEWSLLLCRAPDYPERAREALREMHRQVGDLRCGSDGLAVRGLLVRHLVMPEEAGGTGEIMRFLASEISPETRVNVMDQYSPRYRAEEDPRLSRRITRREYLNALEAARQAGLRRF